MKTLLLNFLNQAIKTYLNLDNEAQFKLAKLNGRSITIELLPFHYQFYCFITKEGLQILDDEPSETQATISGTPLGLLTVFLTKENRNRFFAEDLTLTGNAELAQQVISLFDELHIDWEEYLSLALGDIKAHHLANTFRNLSKDLGNKSSSLTQQLGEFLQEEKNIFPSKEALQDLFNDIDELTMDVDRYELKIKALYKKLEKDSL